ncbi:MAG TPA: hypothetical protein VG965_02340 [Patescibacteria group bacterium]|nr:hypothetical protein [Patescibacteria group bacterium]
MCGTSIDTECIYLRNSNKKRPSVTNLKGSKKACPTLLPPFKSATKDLFMREKIGEKINV